ncbi:uncharacterized protein FFFS_15982 [Fusarium fujikuroi]|nr:uncharacterized protein FFFS_15982 [Fusarium fujikuroi]
MSVNGTFPCLFLEKESAPSVKELLRQAAH